MDGQIQKIMEEERAATLSYLERLDYPREIKPDIEKIFGVLQDAINGWIASEDRSIDRRVVPMALALMHDEMERIYKRFQQAGMAPLSDRMV